MAKKKKPENKSEAIVKVNTQITEEQRQQMARFFGFIVMTAGKVLLESGGCVVDCKINGENITDIVKLHGLDIRARIDLAVKEERYEDAAHLKKLLKAKTNKK